MIKILYRKKIDSIELHECEAFLSQLRQNVISPCLHVTVYGSIHNTNSKINKTKNKKIHKATTTC